MDRKLKLQMVLFALLAIGELTLSHQEEHGWTANQFIARDLDRVILRERRGKIV